MSQFALPPEEPTLRDAPAAQEPVAPEPAAPEPAAGTPSRGIQLEADGMPPVDTLRQAMKAVMDPEIGYNVVDLGLVYDIEKQPGGQVKVTMTLTSMGCPLTELIDQQVSVIMGAMPGVEDVQVDFTFSPPWSPEMMSDDVRLELRAMGMNV